MQATAQNSAKYRPSLFSLLITALEAQTNVIDKVIEMVKELLANILTKTDSQQIREFSSRLPFVFDRPLPSQLSGNFELTDIWSLVEQRYNQYRSSNVISFLGSILTAPFIYSVFIPLILLDLMASIYQAICFPVYGIEKVNRSDFVVIDRHKLPYLSWVEKLNCVYCGYGNGVLAYVSEIASKTESHWCPVKHKKKLKKPHKRYDAFCEYGDGVAYEHKLDENAESWRKG